MPLTFELASFRVAPENEGALVEERPAMVGALRRAFPAAVAAWLTKQDDGSWMDIVLWRSREEAEDAARRINDVPEARSWFRHITESHGLRHVEVVQGEWLDRPDSLEVPSSRSGDQDSHGGGGQR
jgi:hypothetical protein